MSFASGARRPTCAIASTSRSPPTTTAILSPSSKGPLMPDLDVRRRDATAAPFVGQQPTDMPDDLVVADVLPTDDRLWVPLDDGVWSRPLHFDVGHGQYTHVMRVTRKGIVARHRHTGPVFAHILKGRWRYLEHDWEAVAGGFAFEPPGETHTLVIPEGSGE